MRGEEREGQIEVREREIKGEKRRNVSKVRMRLGTEVEKWKNIEDVVDSI